MSHRNIIEINGRQYDALTGKSVDAALKTNSPVIDGINRLVAPLTKKAITRVQKFSDIAPRTNKKLTTKPQKSSTLLRSIVSKPSRAIHGKVSPSEVVPASTGNSTDQITKIERDRLTRMKSISRSTMIQRFNPSQTQDKMAKIVRRFSPLAVKENPENTAGAAVHSRELPKSVFEHSVDKATAHESKKLPKAKLRHRLSKKLGIRAKTTGMASVFILGLVIAGFVAYQNIPSFAMRVAASRAGFAASLPSYTPSGFNTDSKLSYSKGQVSINFRSNSDSRTYSITQKPTDWSPESLAANFVSGRAKTFQTYQNKGLTLFIYNGSNATWIQNGIWYVLDGNSQLNSEQLSNIASSM